VDGILRVANPEFSFKVWEGGGEKVIHIPKGFALTKGLTAELL